MDSFQLQNAIIVFPLRLTDFFVAAYPRKIVFGPVEKQTFLSKNTICIDLMNFKLFYLAILKILSIFQQDKISISESKDLFSFDSNKFSWHMDSTQCVRFFISSNTDEVIGRLRFDLVEFNELLHLFSHCILPSLLLPNLDLEFLDSVVQLDFLKIIELRDSSKAEKFISKSERFLHKSFSYRILLQCHFDLVIIANKLKSFINDDILPNHFDDIIQPNPNF